MQGETTRCGVGRTLTARIKALDRDQVEACADAWGLLEIDGFVYKDLNPSLAQVTYALRAAQEEI
jgi:hypothetical protein